MDTDIRVLDVQPHFTVERARTPVKFGGVVMEGAIYCHVRATVENRAGQRAEGWGAIFLSDVWAWPTAQVGHEGAEQLMRQFVVHWCRRVADADGFSHPVDLFWRLEPELMPLAERICRTSGLAETMPRLAALVSASPVDAALHDAFGNAAGFSTYDGYGKEHMAHDLAEWLGAEFQGRYIADYLVPLAKWVDAFHLVGGLDKLTDAEITADDPDDGLPVSLEQWIRYEGIHCLKVKLRGNDLPWDLQRLVAVSSIARQQHEKLGIAQMWLSADTNEMCPEPEYMVELLEKFRARDRRAFDVLLYVEQPCERDLKRRLLDVRQLAKLKPVLVDEALASLDDLDLARQLGYTGIALKSCKCQSEQLVMAAKASQLGMPFAVQDLTNPGIALLHSVGLAGRLRTIRGVESNSRQFFPATSQPERRVHPGFYKLSNGRIDTSSLGGPGLGYRWPEIGRSFDA